MIVAVLGLLVAWFRLAGTWLVTADPLRPARALVVLGGQVPFRAMEAAELYKQGWAKEVWLTKGAPSAESDAMKGLGIATVDEYLMSQRVLELQGVPADSIRVLEGWNENTIAELRTVRRALGDAVDARVIVVTSKFHTRRVRALWHRVGDKRPDAIVRPASGDPFDPKRWWRSSRGAIIVAREWFGLLNAWLGFPVDSRQLGATWTTPVPAKGPVPVKS